MFCPKCGSQNSDGTRFCRGCGADVGGVLAVVEGRLPDNPALAEKRIDVLSSGIRGTIIGLGFLIVSGVSFAISVRLAVAGVFALALAVFFLGTGVSRLFQAKALKRLLEPKSEENTPALPAGEPEYIKPSRSIYETDDLLTPRSVTEHTTTHLKIDSQ